MNKHDLEKLDCIILNYMIDRSLNVKKQLEMDEYTDHRKELIREGLYKEQEECKNLRKKLLQFVK